MIIPINFQSSFSSIKDDGINTYEVQIIALGSKFGVLGAPGVNIAGTVLGTFSTGVLSVPFSIINTTGADVAAAFSGTFKSSVVLNDEILPEDIKIGFRVQSNTGYSNWKYLHFEAICNPATVNLTVTAPDGMIENQQKQNWSITIQAVRGDGTSLQVNDVLLIEFIKEDASIFGYGFIPVGGDPTDPADIINENNWNKIVNNDGKIGTYITLNNSFSSINLFNGTTNFYFAKKLWAVDNNLAGVDAGENLTIRVTALDITCNQTPVPDTGIMTPATFAEMLLPFAGKQSATPYPEYRYPLVNKVIGGNMCSGSEWFGISLRNGALTSTIKEVRIITDGNTDTFNTDNSPIHFPLPPLAHGNGITSCATPLNNSSTPLIGFDLSAYFTDPGSPYFQGVASTEHATGHIKLMLEIDYDVTYYGLVTVLMELSMYIDAINSDDPDHKPELWLFDNTSTSILIVRGDAAVYGNNTTASGLSVNLAFNINNTKVSAIGATVWTANTKVQISNTPGLIPGAFTEYNIISPTSAPVSGGIPATPDLSIDADSININHMFPSEGIYYIKIVAETDATVDSKIFSSESEGYLIVASA